MKSSKAAYRKLALVEPYATSLRPHSHKGCPSCNVAFLENDKLCDNFRERFCKGGRYGFLWLRRCLESRPHLHQTCKRCGAQWIVAPTLEADFT